MHVTTGDANDIPVCVCLGFWHVVSGGRGKNPGMLRLSRCRSRPRVPCDRKPRHERTVGKLLRKLSFRRLSVRPQHPKSDPEAQASFRLSFLLS